MSTATAAANIQVPVLECSMCMLGFSSTEPARQPFLFSACGHSVCKVCAAGLTEKPAVCSVCNVRSFGPLAKNYALMAQLILLGESRSPSPRVPCDGAQHKGEEKSPQAAVYCQLCDKYLCVHCDRLHTQLVADDHPVVPAADMPTRPVICPEDRAQCLLYCMDCPGRPLVCKLCVLPHGAHHGHRAERVVDVDSRGETESGTEPDLDNVDEPVVETVVLPNNPGVPVEAALIPPPPPVNMICRTSFRVCIINGELCNLECREMIPDDGKGHYGPTIYDLPDSY